MVFVAKRLSKHLIILMHKSPANYYMTHAQYFNLCFKLTHIQYNTQRQLSVPILMQICTRSSKLQSINCAKKSICWSAYRVNKPQARATWKLCLTLERYGISDDRDMKQNLTLVKITWSIFHNKLPRVFASIGQTTKRNELKMDVKV